MTRSRILILVVTLVLVTACGGKSTPTTTPTPNPTPGPVAEAPAPKPEAKPMPTVPTQTATPQNLQFPDEDFRSKQPAAGPQRPFKLPAVKPFTLANGIEVYLVEQHTLPIVSMDLSFDGGQLFDPPGKDGLVSVCMNMLTEGTQKLDKIAYSEALADTASSINAYGGDDSHGVRLDSLTKHLDATFALFADTILSPGMRQSDFDRMIKRRIEGVRQTRGNPASIPGRVAGPILFGAEHPFGAVTTEASLGKLTLDDCKHFVATHLKPKHAKLFVVGDLTEAQVRKTFDSSPLAAWKGTAPAEPKLPAPKPMAGRIFFVNVPDAAQSTVMLLSFGPKRTAKDYFPNSMMSALFGGSFTSRINMNLREDKGYSYGARGGLGYTRTYGQLTVTAPVQANATYQTVLELHDELTKLWSGSVPPKPDELDREKQNAVLALPGRFSTASAALAQYRSLVYYGLPLDYFNTYVDNVSKVTLDQVKQSAAAHLKPGQVMFLVVGDGNAKMIVHNPKAQPSDPENVRRLPYEKDGRQLTLREALEDLAKRGDVGAGGLVELDVDGRASR